MTNTEASSGAVSALGDAGCTAADAAESKAGKDANDDAEVDACEAGAAAAGAVLDEAAVGVAAVCLCACLIFTCMSVLCCAHPSTRAHSRLTSFSNEVSREGRGRESEK